MITEGFSQDPQLQYDTCAAALADTLELIDQQQMREPVAITKERDLKRDNTAAQVLSLAKSVAPEFCEKHCDPSNCIVRTGETIIELNQRILTTSGTAGKKEVLDKLKKSDTIQLSPVDPKCPHTSGVTELMLDDLRRSGAPSGIFTDEAPGLGGTTLEEVIDLEVLADPEGRIPSGPPISTPKKPRKRKGRETNQLDLFDAAS